MTFGQDKACESARARSSQSHSGVSPGRFASHLTSMANVRGAAPGEFGLTRRLNHSGHGFRFRKPTFASLRRRAAAIPAKPQVARVNFRWTTADNVVEHSHSVLSLLSRANPFGMRHLQTSSSVCKSDLRSLRPGVSTSAGLLAAAPSCALRGRHEVRCQGWLRTLLPLRRRYPADK